MNLVKRWEDYLMRAVINDSMQKLIQSTIYELKCSKANLKESKRQIKYLHDELALADTVIEGLITRLAPYLQEGCAKCGGSGWLPSEGKNCPCALK